MALETWVLPVCSSRFRPTTPDIEGFGYYGGTEPPTSLPAGISEPPPSSSSPDYGFHVKKRSGNDVVGLNRHFKTPPPPPPPPPMSAKDREAYAYGKGYNKKKKFQEYTGPYWGDIQQLPQPITYAPPLDRTPLLMKSSGLLLEDS